MEVGPTAHYVMGGVEVDPDTGAASVPGLFAVGEVSGGMHGSNRLGGNSLSDLIVFGRRSGLGAAEYVSALPARPAVPEAALASAAAVALEPLERADGESPYAIHGELQTIMNDLVGLIRRESEMKTALVELDKLRARAAQVSAAGGRAYNPGWHLALDLRNMLVVAECVAQAALERQESPRRPHQGRLPGHVAGMAEGQPDLLAGRRRRRGAAAAADGAHADRSARAVRRGRAEEVHDGGRAGRPRCGRVWPGWETSSAPPIGAPPGVLPRRARRRRQAKRPRGRQGNRAMGYKAALRVWRGDAGAGALEDFQVEANEGEVVLDVLHRLQATQASDLAIRWNCKAGKCGSCSMEINGRPRLACMTRMSVFTPEETLTITPLRTFPVIRDLVTDVSFNYAKAREIPSFTPDPSIKPGEFRMQQVDVNRSQEFRKCIECFLCQDTCHVIRDHPENERAVRRAQVPDAGRRARDAPGRHRRPA